MFYFAHKLIQKTDISSSGYVDRDPSNCACVIHVQVIYHNHTIQKWSYNIMCPSFLQFRIPNHNTSFEPEMLSYLELYTWSFYWLMGRYRGAFLTFEGRIWIRKVKIFCTCNTVRMLWLLGLFFTQITCKYTSRCRERKEASSLETAVIKSCDISWLGYNWSDWERI